MQSWPAGTAQGREGLILGFGEAEMSSNEPCALCSPVQYPGLIQAHGVLMMKEARQCENFYYFTMRGIFLLCKKEKKKIIYF